MMREDWVEVELGDICEITSSKRILKKEYVSKGIPFFRTKEIKELSEGKEISIELFISEERYQEIKEKFSIPKIGNILISAVGTIGISYVIKNDNPFYFKDGNLIWLRKIKGFNSNYLDYGLTHFVRNNKKLYTSGTAYSALTIEKLKNLKILLPPLPIQRAIVKKIETLFSNLDKGIAKLKKAQEQLKIYRQAVLKKAFEGELTKEWRALRQAQGPPLPTADELLELTKFERLKHYEQQLEKWKVSIEVWEENGTVGKKPTKPKVWKVVDCFTKLEIDGFSILPLNWKWVKLGNVFQVFVGSTPSRKQDEFWSNGNINWVSSGEVAFNTIYGTKEKITEKGLVNSSTTIHPRGTVLLAMIGEGKTRGQSAILETEACHNQNTAAIRVSEIGFEPKFSYYYFFLKYERNRRVGSGNNQKALNQGRIMEFDYPLCSIQEQHQIVKEIESRLSVCDQVEQSIKEALVKSEALRQSILKKAFEGKLLSDEEIANCKLEEDYEPAAVLLRRIEQSRNALH